MNDHSIDVFEEWVCILWIIGVHVAQLKDIRQQHEIIEPRVLRIRCYVTFCGWLNLFRRGDNIQFWHNIFDTTVYARREATWSYDPSFCMASPTPLMLPQGSARHPSTLLAKPFMPNENFWWTQHVTSHRDIPPFLPQVSKGRADKVAYSQRRTAAMFIPLRNTHQNQECPSKTTFA